MLQITTAIRKRQFQEMRATRSAISWQTRTLATFIAGGYMTDGKKGNPALDMALKVSIDDIEAAQLEDMEAQPKAPKEPSIGSYERFMSAFGGKLKEEGPE